MPGLLTLLGEGSWWNGSIAAGGSVGDAGIVGYTFDDGDFRFWEPSSGFQFRGKMVIVDGAFVGKGRFFAPPGVPLEGGVAALDVTTVGYLSIGEWSDWSDIGLSGMWQAKDGQSGQFEINAYPPAYPDNIGLDDAARVWDVLGNGASQRGVIRIDEAGRLDGQYGDCLISGAVSPVAAGMYALAVEADVTNCPTSGHYLGYSRFDGEQFPNDTLVIAIDDGVHAELLILYQALPGVALTNEGKIDKRAAHEEPEMTA